MGVALSLAAIPQLAGAPSASAESYEQAVENTSGVAHFWPMGESSGASLADVVGGDSATLSSSGVTLGQPGALVGDSATAALFNGSTGAAHAEVNLSSATHLTIEFWMKWHAFAGDNHLALEFTSNFNEHPGGFLVDPDATPGSDFSVAVGQTTAKHNNNALFERPSAEQWHYYAFVINTEASAEKEITPYVDGRAVSYTKLNSETGAGNFANSTLYWLSRNASTLFGQGSMQDLALYTTTLSATTIAEHYEIGEGGPKASFTSSPVAATVGVPVSFNASGSSSPGGTLTDYAWDFDGSKSYSSDQGETSTIAHTFTSTGTYTIDLRVKDSLGKTATISKTVTVGAALGQYEKAVEETSGLSHFWPMGESSGSSLADAFGGASASLSSGGVTLGEPGALVEDSSTSALFNGSTGAAHAEVNLSSTNKLTIEFWMKWHAFAGDNKLALELTPNFNTHPGGFLVDPDATPGTSFSVAVGQSSAKHNNNAQFERPSAEQWHYYAFVINTQASAESQITPYVDGHAVSFTKINSETGAGNFANSTLYWMSRNASELFGKGAMQDLALYNATLSSSTILEHYEHGKNTYHVVNTTPPSAEGTTKDGQTLTVNHGSWTGFEPISYAYRWERCNSSGGSCTNVSGATGSTYALGHTDVGSTIRVNVTASNAGSSAESTSEKTGVVAALAPSNTSVPTISGTAKDGQTLTAGIGEWAGTPPLTYAYQWQSCNPGGTECSNIEGATGQTYALVSSDLDTTLRVVVSTSNAGGSTQATSTATSEVVSGASSEIEPPAITGDPDEGETLYGEAGQWGGTENEVGYQWERCSSTGGECAVIAGATEADYRPVESDVGKRLRLRVGVSNALGAVTAISAGTEVVGAKSTLMNTWAPSITGTPQSGYVLSASAGSWLGVSSIGYAYQWQRCDVYGTSCEEIAGATASSYTPGSETVGHTLRVRVRATELGGTVSETSALTQPIASATAPAAQAPPGVSGTGLVGYTITATTGTWSGAQPITYTYQWERCDAYGESCSAITGAIAGTYTLVAGDAAHTVRVLVTATDSEAHFTTAASFPLAVSAATLADIAAPSIGGAYEIGRTLSADAGIWTGEGALAYTYKWERCNEKGESCGAIAGATASSYTLSSSDVGKTLKAVVTAEGVAGKESATSAVTPTIGSESLAPENMFAPTIEGNLTSGETLTAQTGTWVSSEAISYSYQWQKCNEEGAECTNIPEATSSTYKLIEGDVNLTLRLLVTGKNSLGTASAESEATEAVGAAGPPINTSMPTINGTAKQSERLVAGNGAWSGSRPLSYYYRWERCNSAGESCAAIEGATKPSYTAVSGDAGSTLRVEVTAKNSLGSAGSVSTQTSIVAGSEASATSAIELTEKTDPSVLQPATVATLEGQEVKPAVGDTGEQLSTNTSLASSTISKETPGEFAVNTPAGELSLEPVNSAPNAAALPTIVNGSAAVYAGTANATDTIVRPDALGATTLLQLRSAEAPTSYSWEVGIGPDQRLEKLANGDVAVVEVPSTSPLEGSLGEGLGGLEPSEAAAEHEGSGESGEAAETALEEGVSGEGTLEKLAAAPTASTPAVEPKSGELHPQETKALYESAKSTVAYSEEHATATTLMVIEPPKVMDAKGNTVSSSLSFEDETVTVTISPSGGTTFPVTAETNIAAMSDAASTAKGSTVRHGLSDPHSSTFSSFDAHLKSGPLHTEIARDAVPYRTPPEALKGWLEAVHTAGLRPYITLDGTCEVGRPCPTANIGTYTKYAERLIGGVLKLHKEHSSTIPLVTLWGAWNEPDLHGKRYNPLDKRPVSAALFWKKARAILRQKGCSRCAMVAGEFAEDDGYIQKYEATFRHGNRTYWPTRPHVWGLHDYHDLVNYYHHPYNSDADRFIEKIRRLGESRVWFSEQGVELQNGTVPTQLEGSSQSEDAKRQRMAANDFLDLAKVHLGHELDSVEVVNYYLYKGPSKREIEEPNHKHLFDSALLPGEGVTEERGHPAENPRQAYCVLALGLAGCPARSTTQGTVLSTITSSGGTVSWEVDPEGLVTKSFVEYGTTEAYGKITTATAIANENGKQSETVALSGLEPCTIYHYQAEAENEANEGIPGLGGDKTFITRCEVGIFLAKDGVGTPTELWEVKADGSGPHSLGAPPEGGEPSLSPDGHSIAYSANKYPNPSELRTRGVGGGSSTTVYTYSSGGPSIDWPRWSPDGSKLIFTVTIYGPESHMVIDSINADGTGFKTLVTIPGPHIIFPFPSYSPDGSKITFFAPAAGGGEQIDVANADGSGAHAITSPTEIEPEEQPRFSPDGTKIAFSACLPEPLDLEFNQRIYTVNVDGSDLTELTHGYEADEEWAFEPEWTPDGSKIVYAYELDD